MTCGHYTVRQIREEDRALRPLRPIDRRQSTAPSAPGMPALPNKAFQPPLASKPHPFNHLPNEIPLLIH
jgi:hypothetical protein